MATTRHIAYGLELHASFALLGTRAAEAARPREGEGELPALALEQVEPEELLSAWSGPDATPAWTGTLGDGRSLRIEHGADGDVLFTHRERAHFRLDRAAERLECAPLEPGPAWQQTLLGRVLPNVAILHGYEALHASALRSPRGVVAILAPAGMGKSTLALELVGRGWPLFTDDVLILGRGPTGVCAHRGTPHMNLAHRTIERTEPELLGASWSLFEGERWVSLSGRAWSGGDAADTVSLVCLLERVPTGGRGLEPLPSMPLALGPYMLGPPGEPREREAARFELYADLMDTARLVRLSCERSTSPTELAQLVERGLDGSTTSLPSPNAGNDAVAAGGAR
jgi:hypothetical protein